ncbi:MAG: 3-hydroxyacyl-ACP dehydratase FabZ [Bacteroidales bacterium]|nr:3-hydroxyacyl-ACP dehydratase FabZ [Bacteroidales bacterium]
MNREELKHYMAHREPMLLVDEADLITPSETVAHYTITGDEFFLKGHFPGNPIVPGVILCEMMAQGSVMLFKDELLTHLALYVGIDKVKFKRSVLPGDTVEVNSKTVTKRGPLIIVDAQATVEGQLCCKGTLSFMLVKKEAK